MFCIKCGTELPNDSRFCFNCGNKVEQASTTSNNTTSDKVNSEINISTYHDFNLFGYNVQVDSRIDTYNSIRKVFMDKANEAISTFDNLYKNRYKNISDFINQADRDVSTFFSDALNSGLELIHKNGAYNVNDEILFQQVSPHMGEWDDIFESVSEVTNDIRETESNEKNYRRARKNSRGRLIGGGFGLQGAVKGIATAGAINAASGMMHSFGNAIGNATSSASARKQEKELFEDPEFLMTLQKAIYDDILAMHYGVVELFNKYFNSNIPMNYPIQNFDESLVILKNIDEGVVHGDNITKAMVEAITKWPYEYQFYELILSKDSSSIMELERYANYFNTDISNIRLSEEKAISNTKRIESHFGPQAEEFMTVLSDNYYFKKLKDKISPNPLDNVTEAYKLNLFSFNSNKMYPLPFDESDKAFKCVNVASNAYAQIPPTEVPLIGFDNTPFSGGKEGFIITNKKIYVKSSFEKPFAICHKDITDISSDKKSNLIINKNKRIDFTLMNSKDRPIIAEFLTFVLFSYKYSQGGTINTNVNNNTPQQETHEGEETSATPISVEAIRDVINSCHKKIDERIFTPTRDKKIQAKFKTAMTTYALIEGNEKPIAVFDNTSFGNGKDGFLLTNRNIYYHNMWKNPGKISLNSIQSINIKGSNLILNNVEIQINLIPNKQREEFKQMISTAIDMLRS